jgi:hypothetical protein
MARFGFKLGLKNDMGVLLEQLHPESIGCKSHCADCSTITIEKQLEMSEKRRMPDTLNHP